jgi:hypothetical protein
MRNPTPRASRLTKWSPAFFYPEMIEDTARIVNEALRDRPQVYLISNNRAGGNAPLIAGKIADRLHSEKPQRLL